MLHSRRWELALMLVVIAPYVAFFALSSGRVGPKDFDQFLVFHELQYWNSALFGLAKQWTPVLCGGLSLAGEPQVPFASLSMLFAYALGPLAGIEIAAISYLLLGWGGAYLYAALWLPTARERALAATLFIGNPFLLWRLAVGQIDFLPFFLLPLFLWSAHCGGTWLRVGTPTTRAVRATTATLLLGALASVAIDGSPVTIIHLLFWVVLYVLALALVTRDAAPVLVCAAALLVACVLDAGYLWPMIEAQRLFPRLTPDRHTTPLALLFHALFPLRGKILPVNGKGHELTVYVGPFVAWLLWRYRHALREMPRHIAVPLLVVSVVSVVLGIGSLRPLHVPLWLSLFDLLRPLPGFRSLEVTGRYWGFLSVPLCLFAAKAICRYLDERPRHHLLPQVMASLLLLQFAIESEAFISPWSGSRHYQPVPTASLFRDRSEQIAFVLKGVRSQGELITPTRGVLDCYDHDDFIHARIEPGAPLALGAASVMATFESWNAIVLHWAPGPPVAPGTSAGTTRFIVNQAWHPDWSANVCVPGREEHNRLALDCSATDLQARGARLQFENHLSTLGARVSKFAWAAWLLLTGTVLALRVRLVPRRVTSQS
ncbi:MAG: hypothetical protein ABI885_02770 [Gammaproteobacteria bacterium]